MNTISTHNRYRISNWLRLSAAITALATLGIQEAGAASGGAGATVPWTTVQAESAVRGGSSSLLDTTPSSYTNSGSPVNGSSYKPYTIVSESSGRQAVVLGVGAPSFVPGYVEFTVPRTCNSIVVRYSIPDIQPTGAPVPPVRVDYTVPLGLSLGKVTSIPVAGAGTVTTWSTQPNLTLTNKFSHYYGDEALGAPSNTPGANHHHYYDEVSQLLPFGLAAGDKVRLTFAAGSSLTTTIIDCVDFELVAPATAAPANAISVISYGADATGAVDSSAAIQAAVNAGVGSGRTVWIPKGKFLLNTPITINNVTVSGAGIWYTTLTGPGAAFYGASNAVSVRIAHLKIDGTVTLRNNTAEQDRAFSRAMSMSSISDVWIEHKNVGAWIIAYNVVGGMTSTSFDSMRIRDLTADGINFNGGIRYSSVTNSHFRNTGDDALAMWSTTTANQNNVFRNNTIELPVTANGIAIYGGSDSTVDNNLVVDAGLVHGGGIHVANRFNAVPLAGTTTISNNTIIRSGAYEPNWGKGLGALWFDARDSAMSSAINVTNMLIYDSPTSAIMFVSGVDTRVTPARPITNVSFGDMFIANTGLDANTPSYLVFLQTSGWAVFAYVTTETGYHGYFGNGRIFDCSSGFQTFDKQQFVVTNINYTPLGNLNWLKSANGGCNP